MRDGVRSNVGRLTRPDPFEPTTWSVPARGREDYTVAPYCHVQYSGIFYLNGRGAQKMNAKSQLDPITERRRNQILGHFPQTTIGVSILHKQSPYHPNTLDLGFLGQVSLTDCRMVSFLNFLIDPPARPCLSLLPGRSQRSQSSTRIN